MTELKEKTVQDIGKLIADNRGKLQAFRFAAAGSKTKNVKEGRNLRREIARLLTELASRKTK
ncbi:MAG: 50S ribosomal protein L29 [Candidatus Taylorbacteria bacterium]|nr:50S ribosomal protein L29 [Candidatus Taylorbacteria bacterium]